MLDTLFSSFTSFETFIILVQDYQYLIAVFTPIFVGELGIYLFGMLFGSGDITILPVVALFLSIITYDILVFLSVRCIRYYGLFQTEHRITALPIIQRIARIFALCEKRYHSFPLFFLFVLKTAPFTKVTIFFFAFRYRVSLIQFVIWDMVVTLLWGACIFVPGILIGRGLLVESESRTAGIFILTIALFIIVSLILGPYIERTLFHFIRSFRRNH